MKTTANFETWPREAQNRLIADVAGVTPVVTPAALVRTCKAAGEWFAETEFVTFQLNDYEYAPWTRGTFDGAIEADSKETRQAVWMWRRMQRRRGGTGCGRFNARRHR